MEARRDRSKAEQRRTRTNDLDTFLRSTDGRKTSDLFRNVFVKPIDRPVFSDSRLPVLTGGSFKDGGDGLIRPTSLGRGPIDFIGVFVTLNEYWPGRVEDVYESVFRHFSKPDLLHVLAALNHISAVKPPGEREIRDFADLLPLPHRDALLRSMAGRKDGTYRLFARQPLLHAMKRVLATRCAAKTEAMFPVVAAAILLSHAAAEGVFDAGGTGEPVFGSVDETTLTQMVRMGYFGPVRHPANTIVWYWRLWQLLERDHKRLGLAERPSAIFESATALPLSLVRALGLGCLVQVMLWKEGTPFVIKDFNSDLPSEIISAFLDLFSLDSSSETVVRDLSNPFDFLELQDRPLIRVPEGHLVADGSFLVERFTSGLGLYVGNYIKSKSGEGAWSTWRRAYTLAVEELIELELRETAPRLLGPKRRSAVYDEADLQEAFGKQRVCDLAIDYGDSWLLVEIVSRDMTMATRATGNYDDLVQDFRRTVGEKLEQIENVTRELLVDESRLTGSSGVRGKRILPMIVIGGNFPLEPTGTGFIDTLVGPSWVRDSRIEELAVLDLTDFDCLVEALRKGHLPRYLMEGWKGGSLRRLPFDFVARENCWAGTGPRDQEALQSVFDEAKGVLKLSS